MSRRRRKHEEHVNHERWLVSYADFITLLFAFFTTLYAISTVDQKKAGKLVSSMMSALNIAQMNVGNGSSPNAKSTIVEAIVSNHTDGHEGGEQGQMAELARLGQRLSELGTLPSLRGHVQVRVDSRGVVISLAEAGFFESGRADLRPGALAALDLIAEKLIAERPTRDLDLIVEGHTDNVPVKNGRFASNWELSTARSTVVVSRMIEKHAYPPARLSVAGYAEWRPVGSNDTGEGRARNRRVDIIVRVSNENNR